MRKLIARLKTESELTGSEREALRARLLAQTGLTETAPHYLVSMFPHYAKVAALSLALIAIGVTPLAIAAEQSEPGDILYPVKTNVTEPIKKAAKSLLPKPGDVPVENPPQTEAAITKSEEDKDGEPEKQERTDAKSVLPHTKMQPDIPIIPGAVEEATPSIQKTVDKIKEQLPLLKGNERKYDKNENQEEKKKKDADDESGVDDIVDTVRDTAEDAKEAADDVKDSIKETVNDVTDLGL